MTPWVVLLPPRRRARDGVPGGRWMQWHHGSHEVLLRGDPIRARRTVDYYIHVQDSLSG